MPCLRRQGCRTGLVSTCVPALPGAARVVVLWIARTSARTRGIVYSWTLSGNVNLALRCVLASSRHSRAGAPPASASLRPGNSAGIATQIVERDEAGFDRPRPCCASHPAGAPEPRQQPDTRWNALIARPRRFAQCRAIGRRNSGRQSQLRRDRPAARLGANEARPACRSCCAGFRA